MEMFFQRWNDRNNYLIYLYRKRKESTTVYPGQTIPQITSLIISEKSIDHTFVCVRPERISPSVRKKAGITLEAALVLPLFLFSVITLLYFGVIIQKASTELITYGEMAKEAATAVTAFSEDQKIIDVIWRKGYSFPFRVIPLPAVNITFRARVRAWSGRDGYVKEEDEEEEKEPEELVYVTETGTVYHRNLQCSYLKLSIRTVLTSSLDSLRNSGGGKYYPCERCGGSVSGSAYVTTYGDRYHGSLECSTLKRTVNTVPLEEAKNTKRPCSKCGGAAA